MAIEHWSHGLWEPFSFATLLRWERGMPWVYAGYGKHRWFPGDGSRTFRTYETWTRHVNALRAPCNRVYRDKRCLLNHCSLSFFFLFSFFLQKLMLCKINWDKTKYQSRLLNAKNANEIVVYWYKYDIEYMTILWLIIVSFFFYNTFFCVCQKEI